MPIKSLPTLSSAGAAASGVEGPAYQRCMDAAAVARRFETSRRREVLSFKHHREVAALPGFEPAGRLVAALGAKMIEWEEIDAEQND